MGMFLRRMFLFSKSGIKCQAQYFVLKTLLAFILTAIGSGLTETHAQSLYKSIGPGGKVIYSSHPPAGATVEKTLEFDTLPSSQVKPLASPSGSAVDLPAGDVILYAAPWCGYCRKAKAYLAEKGITYKEIDIDTDYGRNAFAQVGNGQGIPLLFAHGQRLQGYSEQAYNALFLP